MESAAEFYELLQHKDAQLQAYIELVAALRNHIADAASEHEASAAWRDAEARVSTILYEHGFRSDGRWRG